MRRTAALKLTGPCGMRPAARSGVNLARSALIPDLEEGQYFNDQTSMS
jgi:hypothetical protein